MPRPLQLPPPNVKEQRLYSDLSLGDQASHLISRAMPCHPSKEAHYSSLQGLVLLVMTQLSWQQVSIGTKLHQWIFILRHNEVAQGLHDIAPNHLLTSCSKQDAKILKLLHLDQSASSTQRGQQPFSVLRPGGTDPHPSWEHGQSLPLNILTGIWDGCLLELIATKTNF